MDKDKTNLKHKKISKKKMIIISLLIIIASILIVLGALTIKEKVYDTYKNSRVVEKLNQASVLPYKILTVYKSLDSSKLRNDYDYLDNFMTKDYKSKDSDELFFYFSGYPTDEDDYHLTYIEFSTKKYNVLGIKVGDNIEKSKEQLLSSGFIESKPKQFENGNLRINLNSVDDKTIDSIKIWVKTSYLGNRIY